MTSLKELYHFVGSFGNKRITPSDSRLFFMKVIILAAEHEEFQEHPRASLVIEGRKQLEKQVALLALLGFRRGDILIAHNGVDQTLLSALQSESVDVSISSGSHETLILALQRSSTDDYLVIHSDAIVELEHLEDIIRAPNANTVLSRSPLRLNEPDLKLSTRERKVIDWSWSSEKLPHPWEVFAGAFKISAQACAQLQEPAPAKFLESAVEGALSFSRSGTFATVARNQKVPMADSDSASLRGGSFASLSHVTLVRKSATGPGFEKVRDEFQWLESLPDELRHHFPRVLESSTEERRAHFDMEYYPFENLRSGLMTGMVSAFEATCLLKSVLKFTFESLYPSKKESAPDDWFYQKHILRLFERASEMKSHSDRIRQLVESDILIVNGRECKNPLTIAGEISGSVPLMSHLNPKFLYRTHGDLHFQNMLLKDTIAFNDFILADPRGDARGNDVFYDMGKLMHSVNGKYDFLHTDQYKLQIDLNSPGTSRAVEASLTFEDSLAMERYETLRKDLPELLRPHFEVGEFLDPDWHFKALVSEAFHFSSLMPFHVGKNGSEDRGISMFLTGALLFSDLEEKLSDRSVNP